jgi:ABC-type transport system involved in multi-copper enzyme maturation permease subunit
MWTLSMTVLVGLVASGIAAAVTRSHWSTMSAAGKAGFQPVDATLLGPYFAGELFLGILGILVISSEYATGTIRATFAAAPRRPMVIAAKVLVFGLVTLVISEVAAFGSFLLGQALLSSPAAHATLSSPGALLAVVGTGLFLCVVGLFALGIALLVRHTAGAIVAYVGVILVLPSLGSLLPGSLQHQIERFLPSEIGGVMVNAAGANPNAITSSHDFGAWAGFSILCGYTGLLLAVGTVLLVRRDA